MPVFSGSDIQNVIDQINLDNPTLPWALNTTDFLYGKPQVVANPVNGLNTKIRIQAKTGTKYTGSVDVTYRRRDLTNLFRGISPQITRWVNDGSAMTLALIVPLINSAYGLNLDATKCTIPSNWAVSASGTAKVITAVATDWQYTGSFSITWNRGLQELGLDILTLTDLDGFQWPGGNDFTAYPDRSMFGNFLASGIDITEVVQSSSVLSWTSVTAGSQLSAAQGTAVYDYVNSKLGTNLNVYAYNADTNPQGLSGYIGYQRVLPNASYPEANKPGFAYAVIVNATAHPLFKSNLVFYFNI